MRMLIDMPDDLMNQLLKEAKRREKLAALIGNYDFGYSLNELERMRTD